MSKSRRPNRPFVRPARTISRGAASTNGIAAELALHAGSPAGVRSSIEALEARKLLFSMTVTDDPDGDGIGTATATFGYVIPYITKQIPDPTTANTVTEEFEDEAAPWTTLNPAVPPSGTFFDQSGIRLTYSTISTQPVQWVQGNDTPAGGGQATDDFDLQVVLTVNDSVSFSFFDTEAINPPPGTTTRLLTSAAVTIGGLDVDPNTGSKIELLRDGQVVATFRGAQLAAIRQQVQAGGNTPEQINQNFRYTLTADGGFDSMRISSSAASPDNNGYFDRFYVDDITQTFPGGRFGEFNNSRIFGARVVLTGPIGASVEFLDLYGRQIRNTIALGVPPESQSGVALVDRNDDGVPDFNDGLGRINLSGVDSRTSLTMVGGRITTDDNVFTFELVDSAIGFFDEMQAQGGFGFAIAPGTPPTPTGLPPGTGSILVGSPFVRDNTSAANYLGGVGNLDFNRTNQGVFVTQAQQTIGSVAIHGAVFGSSQFTGAVGRLNFGTMYGSVTINGDLGTFAVAGDAGVWSRDEANPPRTLNTTQSELFVGRTVGEIAIGGRSLVDITVLADINNTSRPVLPIYDYAEKEFIFGIDPATDDGPRVTMNALLNSDIGSQPLFFGSDFYHNNTVIGAEFVGFNSSAVRITGSVGLQDPISSAEDPADVYAFVADGTSDVVVSVTYLPPGQGIDQAYARIVDGDGRVLAAHQNLNPNNADGSGAGAVNRTARFSFRPDHAGVYYLVVSAPIDTNFGSSQDYEATLSGLAPVTFGAYRTGAAQGARQSDGLLANNVLNLSSGSMGSLRIGTGFITGDGGEADPSGITNPEVEVDDLLNFRFSTTTIAGNLYNVTTGSDVDGAQIFVGGNLGTFVTGQAGVVGIGPTEGDLNRLTLQVNGTIGVLDVRGAIGWEHDSTPPGPTGANTVNIRTGVAGGPGHIGSILVGDLVVGNALNITTSAQSIINQFLVGVGGGGDGPGQIRGQRVPTFNLGAGSDVRFADFTQIENGQDPNAFYPLAFGQSVTLTDDAGGSVTIRMTAPSGVVDPTVFTSNAILRFLPINNSLGVAIGRIDVTLNGGANLEITGLTPGRVSIGRINVTADGTGGSQILINSATTEIDIGQITQAAGAALGVIRNNTPGGDIVAIDVNGLNQLIIASGNLGRTQTNGVGPSLLGPYLGIQSGLVQQVGGAIGMNPAVVNDSWNGTVYIPVNQATADVDADETLEDLGGPFDGYLNGLIVRGGNVQNVQVGGSVGSVILQGAGAVLTRLVANSDGDSVLGVFQGIVGTVYAEDIASIDVGDGLAAPGASPFASAGIFAADDLLSVAGRSNLHPVIHGVIVARDVNIGDNPLNQNGLVNVNLVMGRYDGAFMGSTIFDEFWASARFTRGDGRGDDLDEDVRGPVFNISGQMTDLFRSRIVGDNISQINFPSGNWDASSLNATGNLGAVFAVNFLNSTLVGEPLEVRSNEIRVTGNISQISANGSTGDINDLLVDAQGSLLNGILARNISRADIQIDGTANNIFVANDLRTTNLTLGRLTSLNVTNDIRASQIDVAGPITQVLSGANITNTRISATGPDGRIETVRARFFLTGEISAAGAITSITSTEGDIIATIRTINEGATVGTIMAGRDVVIDTDIASDVTTIQAGRHIGQLNESRGSRVINIRGNLNTITAPNGQIYTDVRVAQSITGVIRTGRVAALPGNDQVSRASFTAYGRIVLVDINGDLNGSIVSESGGIGTVRITDGSFRPGNVIRANDGSIDSVTITGGHLLGDIIAEEAIGSVIVAPNLAGFWGDMGVNPGLSQFAPFDSFRNQLPPGVAPAPTFQGPRIQAGTNISLVDIQKASMWESSIVAGHSISRVHVYGVVLNDNITPGLGGSFFIAGDSIGIMDIEQFAGGAIIAAGVTSLGADNRPGGTGVNADTVQFGRIGDLTFRGGTGAVTVSAGINAGADGIYNTADDAVANGLSSINSVTVNGQALVTSVWADNGIGFTSPNIIRGGPGLRQAEPDKVIEFVPTTGLVPSGGLNFTTTVGETGRITLTGPGQAYFEQVFDSTLGRNINRLALINTSLASRLIVETSANSLTDFKILSNDSASLGYASIRANLSGASSFYFDGYVQFAEFGALNTTGSIGAGNDIGSLVIGPATRGTIDANHIQNITIGGDFGLSNTSGEAVLRVLSAGNITIGGGLFGLVSVKRDVSDIRVFGAVTNAEIRSGRSINSINAASLTNARISARNNIGTVTVPGNVASSNIYAGADLGADGTFGGTGLNADTVTNGSITMVNVGGNFTRSDIAAGVSRGADGFLGTADDLADEGHSSIGTVIIGGTQVGSALNSESYRITSNGTVGSVRVGANPNFVASGNFQVTRVKATPDALQVADLRVTESSGLYTARIQFNQPIIESTLAGALNIFEVRDGGTRTVRLAQNVDFVLTYEPNTNTAVVTFSQNVTRRNLPQLNGVPGPGVYRFTLDANVLRGQTQGALLDGNGDGVPAGPDDDFSQDDIVGDAGDKIDPDTTDGNNAGVVFTGPNNERVDFYFASDLNLVLDNNYAPDGLPDANKVVTIRGTIGDHPDNDSNFFRFSSDIDVYRVTLRAGQILRLGKMGGVAQLADRALLDASGNILDASNGLVQILPQTPASLSDTANLTQEQQYLIRQTGTYYIVVAALVLDGVVNDVTNVPVVPTTAGAVGQYNFTVEVFDDADSGFNGDTDSGNGANVVDAPVPTAFAGSDTVLNTADDLGAVPIGPYTFTLNPGADGIKGTADDVVSGANGSGIFSQRTAGPDGQWGTADDARTTFVDASIGRSGYTGVPTEIQPDVDVYKLNNGQPIAPGSRVRATLQLTELGSNIGLSPNASVQDLRGTVQFAIFDITNSTGISDGSLVAAPSELLPVGGTPNTVTSDGVTSYGYDANGDFFIEFIVPASGNGAGRFALYVQGSIRSDYQLVVHTQGTGTFNRSSQNVLLETRGGIIDWLEAGTGVTTTLEAFRASAVGFSGIIGGQTVDNYIVSNLVANLQDIFNAANVDINVSSSASDFQGQDFSTVFVTGSNEPAAFFDNGTFGASEHVDAFNVDKNDQGVVFLPSLGTLGYTPSQSDVDLFVQSLTAAVARRVGELVGLRMLSPAAGATDVMAADSVRPLSPTAGGTPLPGPYRFSNSNVPLSPPDDLDRFGINQGRDRIINTDFFLGQQNSVNLLDRLLLPPG